MEIETKIRGGLIFMRSVQEQTAEHRNNFMQKGSGVFRCIDCGRLTRDTGENEGETKTCRFCLEICSLENSFENGEISKEKFEKKLKELKNEN